ncbi:MAG: hypothetical protein DDT21_01873 [Syntrophomonadaceae bacterium]|nr:hypothetical protein [Bacillota bacterium]
MIVRRTFAAAAYPKGNSERKRLNQNPITSDRHPHLSYVFISKQWGSQLYATLAEAQENEELYELYIRSTLEK